MEIWVNSDGSRARPFGTPYIDQSELHRNVTYFNPEGPGPHYGLYDRTQPTCQRWVDYSHNYLTRNRPAPHGIASPDGRVTTWWPPARR